MVKEKKTFNRIVEEGIYNIKDSDYEVGGLLGADSKLKETPVIVAVVPEEVEL